MGLLHDEGLIIKKAEFTYFFLDRGSVVGERAAFSAAESRHLLKVCRARVGDLIYATDGEGRVYRIQIDDISKGLVAGRIWTMTAYRMKGVRCELAVPIASQQKTDWVIEKGTELGVVAFHLFACDKSISEEVSQGRIERLRRIAVSAIKQSMRYFLPDFYVHNDLKSLVSAFGNFGLVLYGDLGGRSRELRSIIESSDFESILIVVGPEPGFTVEEKTLLEKAGAIPASCGENRLRMETAAIVLPALVTELVRGR